MLECSDDGERLFRHLFPGMVKDGKLGIWAFGNASNPVSVDAERFRSESEELAWLVREKGPAFGLAAIPATYCVKDGRELVYAPVPGNDAHCDIRGAKTRKVIAGWWRSCSLLKEPAGVDILEGR